MPWAVGIAIRTKRAQSFLMRTRPDTLTKLDLPDGPVEIDEYDYLTDPHLWTDAFAHHAAGADGLALTEAHYSVLNFMRDWLDDHGVAPDVRFVLKFIGAPNNLTKVQSKDALYALFPGGYVKQACKIAGLKQPRAWSTG